MSTDQSAVLIAEETPALLPILKTPDERKAALGRNIATQLARGFRVDGHGRAAEVKRPGRLGQDRERLAQIGLDKVGSAARRARCSRNAPGAGAFSEGISMIVKDLVLLAVLNPSGS